MSYFPGESRPPVVLPAGQGQAVDGPTGQPMFIKAGSSDTLGAYAAIEYSHAPGAPGPPAHIHREHEEAFLVIEGELTLMIDGDIVTLGPGGFGLVPRGAVHQPRNDGTTTTRFIFLTSPPLEGFFLEMQQLLHDTHGRPPVADLVAAGQKWDCHFVDLDPSGTVAMHNEADHTATGRTRP